MAQVLAFANQKGGVAKTTSTVNLGVALVEMGKRVLAVDMDPQGNLTMSQGIDPENLEKSMYDVLVHRMPIDDVILSNEIDVAASTIDLAGAEMALSTQIGRERALERALKPMQDKLRLHPDRHAALAGAAHHQRPGRLRRRDRAGAVRVPLAARPAAARAHARDDPREHQPAGAIRGILPTLFDARTLHGREAIEILKENFGPLVFKTVVRKTIKFAEAPVQGSSVLKYDPRGKGAEAYRSLAREVLNGKSA